VAEPGKTALTTKDTRYLIGELRRSTLRRLPTLSGAAVQITGEALPG